MRGEAWLLLIVAVAWSMPSAGTPGSEAPPPPPPQAALAELLLPWASQWERLDVSVRARLETNAARWLALDDTQRASLILQLRELEAMPASQRAVRRANRQALRQLSEQDLRSVAAAAERYARATPEQQQAWRDAFDAQDVRTQQTWALGPAAGGWLQSVRPLVSFVPADEREASLAMLAALPPAARDDLAALVRRLPAAERDVFRRRLLDADVEQRHALIRERLGR